jgi:hypothetical protein
MAHVIKWMDPLSGDKSFVFDPDNPVRVNMGRELCEQFQAQKDVLFAKGDPANGTKDHKLQAFDPSVETTLVVRQIGGG